jgi:hypothetical protein
MFAGLPDQSAKNEAGDSDKFKSFVRQVLSVPHAQVKAKLDAEKEAKKQKLASRASGDDAKHPCS